MLFRLKNVVAASEKLENQVLAPGFSKKRGKGTGIIQDCKAKA